MPIQKFALEEGGEKRLEVSIGDRARKGSVIIKLDGTEVAVVENMADLKLGKTVSLPDGSPLFVSHTWKGFDLSIGSEILPGSASHPQRAVTQAVIAVFWIGGGNLLLGILGAFGVFDLPSYWVAVIVGVVFLTLGYFVQRRSASALFVAIVLTIGLLVWNGVGLIKIMAAGGVPLGFGALAIGTLFLVWMVFGFKAIKRIEARGIKSGR